MEGIQFLQPGTKVRLIGGLDAFVEENPRDGSWLVVSYRDERLGLPSEPSRYRFGANGSVHGMTLLKYTHDRGSLVVVHADDILTAQETTGR